MKYDVKLDSKYIVSLVPSDKGKPWDEAVLEAVKVYRFLIANKALQLPSEVQSALLAQFSAEAEYPKALQNYKELVDRLLPRSFAVEALSPQAWEKRIKHLGPKRGQRLIQELLATNGSKDAPPNDRPIVWGLQHISSGRWINIDSKYGEKCLAVFRTREHASLFANNFSRVVWMHAWEWWKKALDAAKSGHPTHVCCVLEVEDYTEESVFPCRIATTPDQFIGFVFELQKHNGARIVLGFEP